MGMLDGFEVIDAVYGVPSVSITKNGISFNKTTLEKLNCPEYAKALIDKQGKRIAIVPCGEAEKGARIFFKNGRDTSNGVRWNNYDLRTTVERMMGWNLADGGWKIAGLYSEEDDALIFDLKEAEGLNR